MKHLFIVLFSFIILLACEKQVREAEYTINDSKVIIKSVVGNVEIIRDGEVEVIKAKSQMILQSNDIIRTDLKSNVKIFLGEDRGVITIEEKSNVALNNLLSEDTQVNVSEGKIKLALTKITGEKKFSLYTPTAVAGVRGTTFMIDVKSNKKHAFPYGIQMEDSTKDKTQSKVVVLTGAVALLDPDNKQPEKLVDRLHMSIISEGIKFQDIKIEKIDLKDISEFKEITEIDAIKKMKMLDEIQLIKQAESGELDSIISESINVPQLKSKMVSDSEKEIELQKLSDKKQREVIKAKKVKYENKQLKEDDINF